MVVAEQRQEIVLLVIRRWWNDSFGMAADKSLLNQSRLRAGSVRVRCRFGAGSVRVRCVSNALVGF